MRRKRKIDPTLSMLRNALIQSPVGEEERHAQKRLKEMHDLIELVTDWFGDIQHLDTKTLVQLMKLGAKAQKFWNSRVNWRWLPAASPGKRRLPIGRAKTDRPPGGDWPCSRKINNIGA